MALVVKKNQKFCHVNTHHDAGTIFLPIISCGPYTLPKLVYTPSAGILAFFRLSRPSEGYTCGLGLRPYSGLVLF